MILFERWVRSRLEPAGIRFNESGELNIQVNNAQFYRRAALLGSLGFGESYADGQWECDHLDKVIARILLYSVNRSGLAHIGIQLRSMLFNRQSVLRSKRVARQHYDVDTTIFELMLDPYLQYTCGYFANTDNLDQAQIDKMAMIIQKLCLKPGDSLLDIGCGWGGFARFAAENFGIKVSGLSISQSQLAYARTLCKGFDCEFKYGDYRHLHEIYPQKFNAISIIGVTEHIGYKNFKNLYKVMRSRLQEGGLALQHSITRMKSTVHVEPFIDRYIFPGGMVPSVEQLAHSMAGEFVLEDVHNFGADYDQTLMAWDQNMKLAQAKIEAMPGFGQRFYRIWSYYLQSCAALFRVRQAQVMQYVLSPQGVPGGYRRI